MNSHILKTPSRLLSLRAQFVRNKWRGSLMEYHLLDSEEKLYLANVVFRKIKQQKDLNIDPFHIFAQVLFSWGVMCPHPQTQRIQRTKYIFCNACQTCVVNFITFKDEDFMPLWEEAK